MAITILPRDERGTTWGDTLGQGISAGIAALMEGKVAQMRRKYDYNAFEKAGLDPNKALLPSDARKEYVKSFYSQKGGGGDGLQQDYIALRNDALSKGVSPETIRTTDSMTPKTGIQYLNNALTDIKKTTSPYKGVIDYFTRQPSLYAATPQEQAEYMAEQRKAKRQQEMQQGPTQTQMQQAQQSEYNVQTQANEDQKMQSTFDRVNQTAADQVAQGKPLGEQMTQEDYRRQLLEQMEADPTISPEELDFYRLNLTGGPKTFGEKVAGLPVNVLSGATQSIGALGGLPALLESALAPAAEYIGSKLTEGEADQLRERAKSFPEDSPEKKKLLERADLLDYERSNREEFTKPSAINFKDVKENVVRPVAKALGIERLTDVNDAASAIAERFGFVTPQMLLANFMGFAPGLARSAATAAVAETGGYTAEKLTDSPLVGAITSLGLYAGSRFLPGTIKNYTDKGYKEFGQAINKASEGGLLKKVDASPVVQALEQIESSMVAKNTPEAKFIKGVVDDLQRVVRRGGQPYLTVDPAKAWKLDQDLGGNTLVKAKELGGKAMDLLYQARNGLRQAYQPEMYKIDPQATQNLIASRNILSALNAKDLVQEKFAEAGKTNIGFFNKQWYSFKKGIQGLGQVLRFAKPYLKDADYRNMTNDLVVQALTDNIPGVQKAVQTIVQEAEKKQKEKKV